MNDLPAAPAQAGDGDRERARVIYREMDWQHCSSCHGPEGTCDKCESEISDLAAAMREVRSAERERCAKIADGEEELDGEPPFPMKTRMREDPVACLRAAVRATKYSIAAAIRAESGGTTP